MWQNDWNQQQCPAHLPPPPKKSMFPRERLDFWVIIRAMMPTILVPWPVSATGAAQGQTECRGCWRRRAAWISSLLHWTPCHGFPGTLWSHSGRRLFPSNTKQRLHVNHGKQQHTQTTMQTANSYVKTSRKKSPNYCNNHTHLKSWKSTDLPHVFIFAVHHGDVSAGLILRRGVVQVMLHHKTHERVVRRMSCQGERACPDFRKANLKTSTL